jgi:hypothetical protein
MKLFSLRLTTLKSKLYAIVFVSFVVRVVAFFALPNTASNLAPDEGTYASLTQWIGMSKPANDFPIYGEMLYLSARALILPSALFYKLGFNSLDAVRLTASIYGLLTLIAVATLVYTLFNNIKNRKREQDRLIISLVLLLAFLPSPLVWSTLGLRESATTFWVVHGFMIYFLITQRKEKNENSSYLLLIISIVMVFSSRPQVGWIFAVTLIFHTIFLRKTRLILIPILLISVSIGYLGATPKNEIKVITYSVSSPNGVNVEQSNAAKCSIDGQVLQVDGEKLVCKEKIETRPNPGYALVKEIESIDYHRGANQIGAASVIETFPCPVNVETSTDKYFCLAYRAPYTTFTFLFRPILGPDVTSSASLFAAAENIFWLAVLLFVIVMLIRNRRLAFVGALTPSLAFFSLYSVAAGAYEGNMGTAFRHKSLILWVVLLLLASTIVATQQRKAEREGISSPTQE